MLFDDDLKRFSSFSKLKTVLALKLSKMATTMSRTWKERYG